MVDLRGMVIAKWFAKDYDIKMTEKVKSLPVKLILDSKNNLYCIPIKPNNNLYYRAEDIIEAASGNMEKRKYIDDCHSFIRQDSGVDFYMLPEWVDFIYEELLKELFVKDYNLAATTKEQETGRKIKKITLVDLPDHVTSYSSLSQEDIKQLVETAKPKKS